MTGSNAMLELVKHIAEGSVVVSTAGHEHPNLIARTGRSSFLIGTQPVPGSGPHSTELSSSLAACTCVTLRLYADRKHLPLEKVSVIVSFIPMLTGDRDRFDRVIKVAGRLDETQRDQLLE